MHVVYVLFVAMHWSPLVEARLVNSNLSFETLDECLKMAEIVTTDPERTFQVSTKCEAKEIQGPLD